MSNWHSFCHITRGHALALLGKAPDAIVEIENALVSYEATGAVIPGWVYSSLAFAYLMAERPAEGLKIAAKGLELAQSAGDRQAQPELHRLSGDLVLAGDPSATDQGEAFFRASIAAARAQQTKFSEVRSTTSLARLLVNQGRRDEARTMLAEIYNWFTEGFDTADLKDAKALLDELSSSPR